MREVRISAVIITFNEERNIGRCLESLRGVADEVVVLDSLSTDGTEAICRKHGVKWHIQPFAGHIEQKNATLALASFEVVLSLDADEALSPQLRDSILAVKHNWTQHAWEMNRLSNFCGSWIRHGSWYPDRKVRLWHRDYGAWGGQNPHDRIELLPGTMAARLKGDLLHFSYYSRRDFVMRTEHYARVAALAMMNKGKKASLIHVVFNPIWRFKRDYIFRMGFRDGFDGFFIAVINGYGTFLKYAYLKALHRGDGLEK